MSTTKKKIVVVLMLAVLGIAALAGIAGSILSMVLGNDAQTDQVAQPEQTETVQTSPSETTTEALSAQAQPHREALEQAAQQCPTVLTPQRIDRYIGTATGWDAAYESPVVVLVSVAGMQEETWENAGGGDINDVPTAIRNVANLWCGHADTLAGEDVDLGIDLPAPVDADDDPYAAALGLAAMYGGVDNARNGVVANHPELKEAMEAVL